MIKSVKVTNNHGESLRMELKNPTSTGFIIGNISGISPGQSELNISDYSVSDGGYLVNARKSTRNITLTILFADFVEESIEELRHKLYKYFPLKKRVVLTFESDRRTTVIDGFVETVDSNIFSSTEGAEISIVCENPWFRSEYETAVPFNSILSRFKFPFSNESITEKLIIMSELENIEGKTIDYNGEIPTGITVRILVHNSFTKIVLFNDLTDEKITIDGTKLPTLLDGDTIEITTYSGNKKAYLYRADTIIANILNAVVYDTDWITIEQGTNAISYQVTGDDTAELEIKYTNLYSGV